MPAVIDNSDKIFSNAGVAVLASNAFAIGGSNRAVYACVLSSSGSPADPTSVKWGGSGGTNLTKIASVALSPYWQMTVWELINPTATTSTIYVTWAGAHDEVGLISVSVKDADQTTAHGTVATNTSAVNANPTVTVTTTSGELTLGFMMWGDVATLDLTQVAGQSSIQEIEGADLRFEGLAAEYTSAGGTTQAMTWTLSDTPSGGWYMVGFQVNPAGGGGGGFKAAWAKGSNEVHC